MNEVVNKKKVNPIEFAKEVKQEASRVTWPTRKETGLSIVLVLIFVAISGVFFMLADMLIAWLIKLFLEF